MRNGTCITRREGAARLAHRAAGVRHRVLCHAHGAILPGTLRGLLAVGNLSSQRARKIARLNGEAAATNSTAESLWAVDC